MCLTTVKLPFISILLIVAVMATGCGKSDAPPIVPDISVLNGSTPGQQVDIAAASVKDKQTLFEFFSDQCPPCGEMAPVMEKIAAARGDVAIRKVNIDRPGIEGIDFDSPLAEQYSISSVPYFILYDEKAHSSPAARKPRTWCASGSTKRSWPTTRKRPASRSLTGNPLKHLPRGGAGRPDPGGRALRSSPASFPA
ncbi:MAG: thioredoxin family protein [Armatimonadetes bacterium]|nr:thioredoxin family protein [Armatimonadota bacterium]